MNARFSASGDMKQLLGQINMVKGAMRQVAAQAGALNKAGAGMHGVAAGAAAAAGAIKQVGDQVTVHAIGPVNQLVENIRRGELTLGKMTQAWRMHGEVLGQQRQFARGFVKAQQDIHGNFQVLMRRVAGTTVAFQNFSERLRYGAALTQAWGQELVKTGKNIQWAGRQITVGLTLPLGFLAWTASRTAEEFDKQMVRLIKVYNFVGDSFEEESMRVTKSVNMLADAMAAQLGIMGEVTAETAANFAQMGRTGEQLEQMTEETLRAATLGEIELADATELVRTTMQVWDISMQDLSNTMARFNYIENQTGLATKELAESLPTVASVAQRLGFSAEEAAASLAVMREGGVDAKEAATALRTALARVAQAVTGDFPEAQAALGRIGISLTQLREKHGEDTMSLLRELGDMLNYVGDSGQASSDQIIDAVAELTGIRQADRFLRLLDGLNDRFEEGSVAARAFGAANVDAAEAQQVAADELERMRQSASGTAQILRAQIGREVQKLGETFLSVVNFARRIALTVLEFFNNMPDTLRNSILIFSGIFAALGPIAMMIGILRNGFGQLVIVVSKLFRPLKLATLEMWAQRHATERLAMQTKNLAVSYQTLQKAALGAASAQRQATQSALPGMSSAGGTAAARARRFGGAGIAGGIALVAGIGSAIAGINSGLGRTLNLIMQIGFGVSVVHAALTAVGVTVSGPIIAAAAAAAGAFALLRWRSEEVERSIVDVTDAAKALAESSSIQYEELGNTIESSGTAKVLEFGEANAEAIRELQRLYNQSPSQAQAFAFQIAYELKRHGATDEEIKEQMERLEEEAKVDIDIDLVMQFDPDNAGDQIAERLKTAIEGGWVRRGGLDMFSGIGLGFSESISVPFKRTLDEIARTAVEALRVGDVEIAFEALESAQAELNKQLEAGEINSLNYSDAMNFLVDQFIEFSELQGYSKREAEDLNDLYTQTASGAVGVATAMQDLARVRAAMQRTDDYRELQLLEARYDGLVKKLQDAGKETENATDANKDFMDSLGEVGGAADDARQDIDDYLSAFRDSIASEQEKIADAVTGAFDQRADAVKDQYENQRDALQDQFDLREEALQKEQSQEQDALRARQRQAEEALDKRQETEERALKDRQKANEQALRDRHTMESRALDDLLQQQERKMQERQENELAALENSYDAQIKKLEESIEKEEQLDERRQYYFERQRARLDYQRNQAETEIGIETALARGELGEAAILRQRYQSEREQFRIDEAEAAANRQRTIRERQIQSEIDLIEQRRDAAVEAMQAEHELQQQLFRDREESRKRALQDSQEEQRRALQRTNELQNRALKDQHKSQSNALRSLHEQQEKTLRDMHESQEDALQDERKLRERQIEMAERSAQRQLEAQRNMIDGVLDRWKEVNPRTEQEWNRHLGELKSGLEKAGIDFSKVMQYYTWKNPQKSIRGSFKRAVDASLRHMTEEQKWEAAGQAVAGQFAKGFVGSMEFLSEAVERYLMTGDPDVFKRVIDLANKKIAKYDPKTGRRSGTGITQFHTGGKVGGRGDVPAMLQSGEYVIRRKAVDALGKSFLDKINNAPAGLSGESDKSSARGRAIPDQIIPYFHSGGPVGGIAKILSTGYFGRLLQMFIQNAGMGFGSGSGMVGPRSGGSWPARQWRTLSSNTRAAMNFIQQTFGKRGYPDLQRPGTKSDHGWGKALDIPVTRIGSWPTAQQRALGWQIANWFVQNPNKFGTKYVIWDGKIFNNSRGDTAWRTYTSSQYNTSSPTGGHYDHPHISFLKKGGTAKMDTPAFVHKGETTLTEPLSEDLKRGIKLLASGTGDTINVHVYPSQGMDEQRLADKVVRSLDKRSQRRGTKSRSIR